jgi:AbrB family looped-hinge helix DNA binding protein
MQGVFKGKLCDMATVGERGQVVIPAEIRKSFNIKSGDKLIVIAKPGMIGLAPMADFNRFLNQASKLVSKLNKKDKKR